VRFYLVPTSLRFDRRVADPFFFSSSLDHPLRFPKARRRCLLRPVRSTGSLGRDPYLLGGDLSSCFPCDLPRSRLPNGKHGLERRCSDRGYFGQDPSNDPQRKIDPRLREDSGHSVRPIISSLRIAKNRKGVSRTRRRRLFNGLSFPSSIPCFLQHRSGRDLDHRHDPPRR